MVISSHSTASNLFITWPMTSYLTRLVKGTVYLTPSRMKPILITISGSETVQPFFSELIIHPLTLLSRSQRKREPLWSMFFHSHPFPELLRRWPIWGKSNVNPQSRATQLSQCTASTPTHDPLPLEINCISQFTENGFGGLSKIHYWFNCVPLGRREVICKVTPSKCNGPI